MNDSIWHYQVRLVPLVVGLSIFGLLHLLRRLTKIEYTPSYFALFPISMLDYQLSEYFGWYYGEYVSIEEGRKRNTKLYIKSMVSFFLTFFLIPFVVGLIVSFFILPKELNGFLFMLLLWQAISCIKATLDFSFYQGAARKTWLFFGSFYLSYLICLFFVLRQGYKYAQPFASNGNFGAFFSALENDLAQALISVLAIGVLSNLFAHWLINRDALKPKEAEDHAYFEEIRNDK